MRLLLDTSVLIAGDVPAEPETAISTVSIAELHFGLLVAAGEEERALRTSRLGLLEARFPDPLALDDRVARSGVAYLRPSPSGAVGPAGAWPTSRSRLRQPSTVSPCSPTTPRISKFIEDLVDVRAPKKPSPRGLGRHPVASISS